MDIEHRQTLPNPNKLLFARAYIETSSRTKAIDVAGRDYTHDLETIDLIKELQAELRQKAYIDLDSHLSTLVIIRDKAMENGTLSVALNAEIARGRAGGLYIERSQVDINGLTNVSSAELRKRLMQISEVTDTNPIKHVESIPQIESPDDIRAIEEEESYPRSFSEVARREGSSSGSSKTEGSSD